MGYRFGRDEVGESLLAVLAAAPAPCPDVLLPLASRTWQAAITRDFPVLLPLWSAEAVGTPNRLTLDVSAAWAGLYLAAKLLDDLQDGDPSILGHDLKPHTSLNLATALIFASGVCLSRVGSGDTDLSQSLVQESNLHGLEVTAGQELGARPEQDDKLLEWSWQVLSAKGGRPFALACRVGALSAGAGPEATAALADVGQCIGEMVQLIDDLLGMDSGDVSDVASCSMPVAFGLSVMEGEDAEELPALLDRVRTGEAEATPHLFAKLRDMGADRYLRIEASAKALRARQALSVEGLDRQSAGWAALEAAITWLDPLNQHVHSTG